MRPFALSLMAVASAVLILAGEGAVSGAMRGGSAQAASFDCARARTADERAVCGNRVLEDKDVELATLYGLIQKLVPMGSRDVIRREQSQWIAARGRCGADVPCIRRSYDRRITALRATIDERVVSNGPF
ncbi:hypothetical protein BH10PSE2_BH10PSE2_30650 [soil metagenome]